MANALVTAKVYLASLGAMIPVLLRHPVHRHPLGWPLSEQLLVAFVRTLLSTGNLHTHRLFFQGLAHR